MSNPITFNNGNRAASSLKMFNLNFGLDEVDYGSSPGGLTWYNGIEPIDGYVIYSDTYSQGSTTIGNAKPTAWGIPNKSIESLLDIINALPERQGLSRFSSINSAISWLIGTGKYHIMGYNLGSVVTDSLQVDLSVAFSQAYLKPRDSASDQTDFPTYTGPTLSVTSGLALWLDGADDSSFSYFNGSFVSQWNDKSGNNKHATATATSSAPVRTSTKNTYAIVFFDGDDILTTPNVITDGSYTKIAVHKFLSGANMVSSSNGPHAFWYGGGDVMRIYHGGDFVTQTTNTRNTWTIGSAEFDTSTSPYTGKIYINNGSSVSGTTSTLPGTSNIQLGGFSNGNFGTQYLAEVLVYNRVLTSQERTDIQTYLNNKWGITTNSPSVENGGGGGATLSSTIYNGIGGTNGSLVNGLNYLDTFSGGTIVFDGADDYISFNAPNLGSIATVEMFTRIPSTYANTMFFGWQSYDVWCSSGNIGYNTGASDVYGISSATVSGLNLVNRFAHYVFEMRSDVSYTNNKMYINGKLQTLSQQQSSENSGSRNFSSGNGRIASWGNGGFNMALELSSFRVYNRALTESEVRRNMAESAPISKKNLSLHIDAGNPLSYSGSGTTVFDRSGNGRNGTLVNGVSYDSTNMNWNFDGSDDYINFNGISLDTSSFSCESFFQWSTVGGDRGVLHSLSYNYPTTGYLIRQADTANNRIVVWSDNGTETSVLSTATVPINTWTHLVIVQSAGNCKIYINGVLDSSQSLANPIINTAYPYRIGQRGSTGAYLPGKIAISRIYNYALNATDVEMNYNAQKSRFGK
jgi:hypothetical protein